MKHPYLASLLFGRPLAIEPGKLRVILHVLSERLEIAPPVIDPGQLAVRTREATVASPEPAVAVIEVLGSLVHRSRGLDAESGLTSYESIGNQLMAAASNPLISGILLHIDSPGGEVAGAFPLAQLIGDVNRQKPVWASVDEAAWSAGYLIASQAERVLLSRNGSVGSIGIVLIHVDESKRDEKEGLEWTFLTRGERKADFNPHEPLTKGARAWADQWLDREYNMFVEAVVAGRGLDAKKIRGTEAAILPGEEAIASGFADGYLGFRESANELLAHVRMPRISMSKSVTKEIIMADPVVQPSPPPTPPVAQAAPVAPVEDVATTLTTTAQSEQIAELCKIAGKPHLVADFILQRTKLEDVKKALLATAAAADEQTEVLSVIDPQHGASVQQKPKQSLASLMRARYPKEATR